MIFMVNLVLPTAQKKMIQAQVHLLLLVLLLEHGMIFSMNVNASVHLVRTNLVN